MIPTEVNEIEDRLRSAYSEAAGTVRPDDIRPAAPGPGRVSRWRLGLSGRVRIRVAAPLAAAIAIVLVIIVTTTIPHGSLRETPAGGRHPAFTASISRSNFWIDVGNATTGRRLHAVKVPHSGTWTSVTAEAGGNFVAVEATPGDPSRLYRIHVSTSGKTAMKLIAALRNTYLTGAAITPNGGQLAYQNLYTPRGRPGELLLGIRNLKTGRNLVTWPTPYTDNLSGLSIAAAGNEIAVSVYYYLGHRNTNTELFQHTYILRPGSSGTPLQDLPALNNQAGPLALSPNGKTLYEILQATGLSPTSFRSHKTVTFELAAISTATGHVTAVLHRWHASYQDFVPMLALDPSGRYLLVVDKTATATVDLRTGRYAALSGKLAPAVESDSHPGFYGGGPAYPFNPVAW